jgi:hypothetical protein
MHRHQQEDETVREINQNDRNGQAELADLTDQARALVDLTKDLLAQIGALERVQAPAHNGGLDLRPGRVTPDQLLDAWIAARGPKSEAFLLDRIYKRRVARRVAL